MLFNFIRKWLAKRKELALERDRECVEMLLRIRNAMSKAPTSHASKEALETWLNLYASLKIECEITDFEYYQNSSRCSELIQIRWNFIYLWNDYLEKYNNYDAIYSKLISAVQEKFNTISSTNKLKIGNIEMRLKTATRRSGMPLLVEKCTCCGKDGRKKKLYYSQSDAEVVAEYRTKETGIPLHIYACPHGDGFHLTSNI